jgi:redox-sensing transcriptional repressor
MKLSKHTINRLSYYRRLLSRYEYVDQPHVFSHDLARMAGLNPVQVRSDIRAIGFSGNHRKGYHVHELISLIDTTLSNDTTIHVALFGVGRLGKAILGYIEGNPRNFTMAAAFDLDPSVAGKNYSGIHCYHITKIKEVIREKEIKIALLATPEEEVHEIAGLLCDAGIRGFLNFTAERLIVPEDVYVKNCDVITLLEEVGYFGSSGR